MGRWVAVILLSASMVRAQADPSQKALELAIQAQQSGHYTQAIQGYETFLKAHPDAAEIRSNLGAALAHKARYPEAVQQYRLALKAQPSNAGIRLNLGLAYYKMGEVDRAQREFASVYAARPKNPEVRRQVVLLLAECDLVEGKEAQVVALLDPLADREPNNLTLDFLLGTALIRVGHAKRGAVMIQRLLGNGDSAAAHLLMAYTFVHANRKWAGLAEVNKALALDPNLAQAYTLRGRLEYQVTQLKGAKASFRKALELDPNDYEALLFLGTMLREQGSLKPGGTLLERAIQMRPRGIRIRYQVALLFSQEGHNRRAAALLEALIKDMPQYTEAHRTLATLDFRLGRVTEGREQMKIARQLDQEIQAQNLKIGRTLKK